ncbi:MAG: FAD-dependent oxidoreductase, partial [Actinomycetota bacterium]|nr:FAD-dependent oxidoreductase [Actinomycetota bacterium]
MDEGKTHRLKQAMANFSTGIVVVTTRGEGGEPLALTANSLTSVSVDPPLVLVCLRRHSETLAGIQTTGQFAINILGEHQAGYSTRFAGEAGSGSLEGLTLIEDGTLPPLLPESLGHLQCRSHSHADGGDHEIVVGEVIDIAIDEAENRSPLLFHRSRYSRLIGHLPPEAEPAPAQVAVTGEGPPEPKATIAVIGGGASGVLTAVQLMRRSAPGLRVVLVEKSERIGPGLAYRTDHKGHRLNVPAGQMIAMPDRPLDFLEWVRQKAPDTQPQEYLSRQTFGRYLVQLLDRVAEESRSRVVLERVNAEAVALRELAENGGPAGLEIEMEDGETLVADRTVLALGNARPSDLPGLDPAFVASDHYVPDPWAAGALDQALGDDSVLLIGTGLTMVDVALVLGGVGGPTVYAVSRHGLLPRPHGDNMPARGRPVAVPDDRCSLTELTSRLLTEIATAAARGEDWRMAFDSLRPITNDLWHSLDRRDQRRFVTDLSRIWGVHRHRMAPSVALALERLKVNRRLRVYAGSIDGISLAGEKVDVNLQLHGVDPGNPLVVDRVINCTGPTYDPRKLEQPLVGSLMEQGLLRVDSLGIGFDVDLDGALVNESANVSDSIYAIGPLRNGVLLE